MSQNKNKYRIVFIHGFLGSANDWQQVAGDLSRQQLHEVFTPTLPGHGSHPEEPPGQSMAGMTEWLVKYLNGLSKITPGTGEHQLILIGYSLGGRLLLDLAAQIKAGFSGLEKPSIISGMVIESANPGLVEQEKLKRWQQDLQWSQLFADQPLKETLEAWYQQEIFSDLDEAKRANLIVQRSANDPGTLAKILLACSLARQPDYREVMLRPPFPLFYWYGSKDKRFWQIANELHNMQSVQTRSNGAGFGQVNPVLKITEFSNAGHNCHLSDPSEYVRQLLAVLSEQTF